MTSLHPHRPRARAQWRLTFTRRPPFVTVWRRPATCVTLIAEWTR